MVWGLGVSDSGPVAVGLGCPRVVCVVRWTNAVRGRRLRHNSYWVATAYWGEARGKRRGLGMVWGLGVSVSGPVAVGRGHAVFVAACGFGGSAGKGSQDS